MTQLSPLMWLLLTPWISLMFISFMTNLWWAQHPQFKGNKLPMITKMFKKWSW